MAEECTFVSGPSRVAMLQLFTSEGCSSCPPADRWLSSLDAQGFKSDQVVPLAMHVDYWDYIGWKDIFSKPEYSEYQRRQAMLSGSSFVYTPQVMINGRDFRSWTNSKQFEEFIAAINHSPAHAVIQLSLSNISTDSFDLRVTTQTTEKARPVFYIAVFENNRATQVKGGENSGRLLHHDYVVRELLGPYTVNNDEARPWKKKILLKPEWNTKNMGVAAFVQNPSNGEILQAVATKLGC